MDAHSLGCFSGLLRVSIPITALSELRRLILRSPFGSAIFTPALDDVSHALASNNRSLADLSVSAYVLGFAVGPLVVAPLSEVFGRLKIYKIFNLVFLVGNVACSTAWSVEMLIVFRFLTGCAGASPLTQGSGTISDMIEKGKHGKAMSVMAFGAVCGPIIGPMLGGFIAEKITWRACFGLLATIVCSDHDTFPTKRLTLHSTGHRQPDPHALFHV